MYLDWLAYGGGSHAEADSGHVTGHELHGVIDRIDILTGTLGKALGGGSGGYTSGRAEIIQFLRQRSRPYLFSNSLLPPVLGASLKSLEILTRSTELAHRLIPSSIYWGFLFYCCVPVPPKTNNGGGWYAAQRFKTNHALKSPRLK
mgnify:CR=1 FL=1